MKIKIATICFMVGILLIPRMGFTADSKSDLPDPTTIVKDSEITNKINRNVGAIN